MAGEGDDEGQMEGGKDGWRSIDRSADKGGERKVLRISYDSTRMRMKEKRW